MGAALTMIGVMLVFYGLALAIASALGRRKWNVIRDVLIDEARRERIEAAAREHQQARAHLEQDLAKRRN